MTTLWFLLGVALIFIIARYNESNKLFWILFLSFIMGFAGAKMLLDSTSSDEQSNGNLTQVCPTQVPFDGIATTLFITSANLAASKVTDSNPVSQETPEQCETDITLSKVFGKTRDQPSNYFNTS